MIGNGDVFYHLTHVDDVARGFVRAAEVPEARGDAPAHRRRAPMRGRVAHPSREYVTHSP